MFLSTRNCSRCRLEARAEYVLPEFNCLALGRLVVGSGDRVECLLGRLDKQVAVLVLIVLGDIVVEVDRVEDLERRVPAGRKFRRRVEVGERDLAVEAAVDNEGEELLESPGIVTESKTAVSEMNPEHLDHEALALEITITHALPGPPLREPDELREMCRIGLLAAADEVQMLPHTGPQPGTII